MRNTSSKINFIYSSIYQFASIMIPLITTPYLSRTIGATGVGEYSYSYSIAYYFTLFIKLGLDNYGNRTIAYARAQKEDVSEEFWNIYASQFILGCICTVLYLSYCRIFASSNIVFLLQSLYVVSTCLDITWFYWGMEQFRITVARDFIIKIVTTLSIFLFVKSANDTWIYTLIISFGFLISQGFLWISLYKYVRWVKPQWKKIRLHIKPNLILFIPSIAVSIYKTMDKIMLGYMSGTLETGFYESSERIIRVPLAFVSSLGTVMLPKMSFLTSSKNGREHFESVFERSISFAMFMSTCMGFGIMTVSKEFVPWFYGNGFEKCIILFKILLPSCMFLAFGNVVQTQYLIPNKEDRLFIVALMSGAVVNLTLNTLLIPRLGSVGAAIGTLMAEASVCIVETFGIRKKISVLKYFLEVLPYIFSGGIMFIVLGNFHLISKSLIENLIIKIGTGGIIYVLSLIFLSYVLERIVPNALTFISIIKTIIKRKEN